MSSRVKWCLMFAVLVIVSFASYSYGATTSEITMKVPLDRSVDPALGLSCEALIGSMMYGEIKKNQLEAELFKASDKIAVTIDEDNKFSFMTAASVNAGDTKSSEN